MSTVRLATRASDLALAQARLVASMLEAKLGVATELLRVETSGDRLQGVSLAKLGGKGLFVKEIEEALFDHRADLAVHSAKDLPAALPEGLELAAFPERADPRDALVARERGATLESLPRGARVGTGSVRRMAQLRALRPDLEAVALRGNVPTRLRKLESEKLDAVILACAGLERLGLADRIDERLAPEAMLPAVTQGILAIEGRAGDPVARDAAALDDAATAAQAAAERAVLVRLGADCNVPLGAYAEASPAGLRLRALLAATEGDRLARAEAEGAADEAGALGERVADALLANGGAALLAELRAGAST
jgi:hydroxymethylbilane synthase